MSVLVPALCEHVHDWIVDLQFRAAESLVRVVAVSLSPEIAWIITVAAYRVVDKAEKTVEEEGEREAFYELWGGVINDALLYVSLSQEQIPRILELVDAGMASPVAARRKLAARVTGSLAQTFPPTQVSALLLSRALLLADDKHVQVRGTVGESLAFIGARLPVTVTENTLWPRFVEFLEDEDVRVRATALRTVSHILMAKKETEKSERLFKDLFLPVLLHWANYARQWAQEDLRVVDDDTYLLLEVIAEVFGNFVHSVSLFSRLGFRKQVMKAFVAMALCNGPLIRRNCAYNMPGMTQTLGSKYGNELSNVVEQLSRDADDEVRSILAAGMHHTVANLVNAGKIEKLLNAVANLLQDDNGTVRLCILEHFAETLRALVKEGDPTAMRRLTPVLEHVRFLSQGDWHIQEQFAKQLGDVVNIIPASLLRDKVLPLLLELTETGVYPVRLAAVHSIIRCFRYFRDADERGEAVERFWGRLKNGTHIDRLSLLEGGRFGLQCFSTTLFQKYFSNDMLLMAKDPISNVRLKLALILPELATICEQSPEFMRAYHSLAKDRDVDVRYAIQMHNRKAGKIMQAAREFDRQDRLKSAEEEKLYNQKKRDGLGGLTQAAENVKVKMDNLRATQGGLGSGLGALKRTGSRSSNTTRADSEASSVPEPPFFEDGDNGKGLARSSSLKEAIAGIASNLVTGRKKSKGKGEINTEGIANGEE
eukprot:CAMPEP_0198336566 /NCGR_PEP_ID=MMETSP1450-20131203/21063_1 /TAXON_ID=753684 ORGANISM="Madagascaria erythrocladiodes, Strain CCMP3234" /NCGR_SAMPLE_ID=MMETSP1450 /ASSEMBLY_ACC=CAM_ASM_001115 /LENGTH=709 /DNA_ID=CAMNT_0044041315 /DNA_START=37 /DNA_END=2166 /DNA_ORIENTATION=+